MSDGMRLIVRHFTIAIEAFHVGHNSFLYANAGAKRRRGL